jgi:hypothetical protein
MPAGVSAYTALANVTLGSSASTVTFSSISGSYRDLVLVIDATLSGAGQPTIELNSDSGNYSMVMMGGTGSSTQSATDTLIYIGSNFSNYASFTSQINLMDYSATDKHKTVLIRAGASATSVVATAARWANTAAVTSIRCRTLSASTYQAGSTFALYGVSA